MIFRSFLMKLDRYRSRKGPLSRHRRSAVSWSEFPTFPGSARRSMRGISIDQLVKRAAEIEGIRRSEIQQGDWILVQTRNSLYSICSVGGNRFSVSGGWFDREGVSPQETTIEGCTWGGRAININLLAAKGLFLGFGNSVVTTRIRDIRVYRDSEVTFQA